MDHMFQEPEMASKWRDVSGSFGLFGLVTVKRVIHPILEAPMVECEIDGSPALVPLDDRWGVELVEVSQAA